MKISEEVYAKALHESLQFIPKKNWPLPDTSIWLTITPEWRLKVSIMKTFDNRDGLRVTLHEYKKGKITNFCKTIIEYDPGT